MSLPFCSRGECRSSRGECRSPRAGRRNVPVVVHGEIPARKWRTACAVRAHRKAGACDRFAILENALCLSHSACYN
ncbi:hypothetical protein BUFA31_08500 [Butyricicoccus faecihominis]|uniref:Uncharacterized protein n=1 Tax=Butyricicoccus faecihominis TaxID=1712515 RepID=A0ABQ1DY96_9FIRM|nr:hypothetical protein BUFA31_08500 [Butyricicoccus faecihominis]GGM64400.1 hypothetical protein GCM10007040_04470 [Butyricicoccus faecihominis]